MARIQHPFSHEHVGITTLWRNHVPAYFTQRVTLNLMEPVFPESGHTAVGTNTMPIQLWTTPPGITLPDTIRQHVWGPRTKKAIGSNKQYGAGIPFLPNQRGLTHWYRYSLTAEILGETGAGWHEVFPLLLILGSTDTFSQPSTKLMTVFTALPLKTYRSGFQAHASASSLPKAALSLCAEGYFKESFTKDELSAEAAVGLAGTQESPTTTTGWKWLAIALCILCASSNSSTKYRTSGQLYLEKVTAPDTRLIAIGH